MTPAIWIVLLVNTLVYSAHRGSKVAMALRGDEIGAGAWEISVLASLYAVVPMVLAFTSGRWSDRLGVVGLVLLGTALVGMALAIPVLDSRLAALFAAAVLIGAGHIVYQVSMQNAVGQLSTQASRVKNYAAYSLTVSLSAVLGPFVAAIAIDHLDYRSAFAALGAAAIGACVLVLCAFRLFPARPQAKAATGAIRETPLLRHFALRRVIVVSALVMAAYDLFSFYLPLHARAAGLSASTVGIVLAFFGSAAVVVRFALPALVARHGDERLLGACLLLSALAYALMPLCRDAVSLCFLSFGIGLTLGCCPALLVPMTYARAPEGRSGEALGLRLTASYGAHAAVPAAFGGLGMVLGMAAIFWSNTVLLLLGVAYLRRGATGKQPAAATPATG
jgi:predicted MFS family arabinose efflux permease